MAGVRRERPEDGDDGGLAVLKDSRDGGKKVSAAGSNGKVQATPRDDKPDFFIRVHFQCQIAGEFRWTVPSYRVETARGRSMARPVGKNLRFFRSRPRGSSTVGAAVYLSDVGCEVCTALAGEIAPSSPAPISGPGYGHSAWQGRRLS